MSVEEALGRMRLLLARRSVVARRLRAAADGPARCVRRGWTGCRAGTGRGAARWRCWVGWRRWRTSARRSRASCGRCRRGVEGPILALPPGPHRLVMRLRYLEWRAVSDVANGAGYERRYTYKLLEEGERRLAREESAAGGRKEGGARRAEG